VRTEPIYSHLLKMLRRWGRALAVAGTLLAVAVPLAARAGPPFLTDDPVPVDFGHYETYVFTQWDNAPGNGSTVSGPASELNWGFRPNLQFHLVTPLANVSVPGMSNAFGFSDTEVGIKYRFVTESRMRPQIAIFPTAELATGNAARNLGNGQTWYRLPVWIQKSFGDGKWTVDTGGGVAINHAPGQRDYGFGGLSVQRALGSGLTLGTEVFTQGSTALGTTPTTFYNVGSYINVSNRFSIFFRLGHSTAGRSQAIGYFALYYAFPHPSGPLLTGR
jgi:hypothetical protein